MVGYALGQVPEETLGLRIFRMRKRKREEQGYGVRTGRKKGGMEKVDGWMDGWMVVMAWKG